MQLPLILQKRLEFVAAVVKIDANRFIDVDACLSFLHVIIVLRRQPSPRNSAAKRVLFQQIRREFRLCAEEAKVAIVKIRFPCCPILLC